MRQLFDTYGSVIAHIVFGIVIITFVAKMAMMALFI